MREREKERGRNRTGVAWLGREETRRLVYSGDLDANERFEALFDIRHDFIKHSSNVQTLYIELYSRSFPVAAPDDDSFRAPLCHSESIVHPVSLSRLRPTVCCCAAARHTMRITSPGNS